MFIKTEKGSFIPLANVKGIRPTEKGSIIILNSGERILDKRTPCSVAQSVEHGIPDITEILVDNIKQLQEFKLETKVAVTTLKEEVTNKLTRLGIEVKDTTSKFTNVSNKLHKDANKLTEHTKQLDAILTGLRGDRKSVDNVIKLLQEAIEGDV
jgi:hypothetical protein